MALRVAESQIRLSGPNDSNSFGGGQLPDATGEKARLEDRQLEDGALWFNPAAFRRAPQFTFGNASRNLSDVRVPGNSDFDILIEKRFSITERYALDFRTELFNAFNSTMLSSPALRRTLRQLTSAGSDCSR